jgi:hypothetical protein
VSSVGDVSPSCTSRMRRCCRPSTVTQTPVRIHAARRHTCIATDTSQETLTPWPAGEMLNPNPLLTSRSSSSRTEQRPAASTAHGCTIAPLHPHSIVISTPSKCSQKRPSPFRHFNTQLPSIASNVCLPA